MARRQRAVFNCAHRHIFHIIIAEVKQILIKELSRVLRSIIQAGEFFSTVIRDYLWKLDDTRRNPLNRMLTNFD
jgi:hypothetical protein